MAETTEARKPLTDVELRKLAADIYENRVLTSAQVPIDMIPSVFMVLLLMGEDGLAKLREEEIAVVYEYMSKAGPQAINGYPMFMSMRCLTKDEWDKVYAFHAEYKEMREQWEGGSHDNVGP